MKPITPEELAVFRECLERVAHEAKRFAELVGDHDGCEESHINPAWIIANNLQAFLNGRPVMLGEMERFITKLAEAEKVSPRPE